MIDCISKGLKRNSRKADRGEARVAGVAATSLFANFRVSRSDLRSKFLPAFTLIELLIVVALIATLMTIVFRLGSAGERDQKVSKTVLRLAKLENCLSGYYAAYGNYPPVAIHNSRDIYQEADGHGVQSTGNENKNIWNWKKIDEEKERLAWKQVEAACRAQPVGAEFPFASDVKDDVLDLLATLKNNLQSGEFKNYPKPGSRQYEAVMAGFDSLGDNLGRFSGLEDETSWRKLQLFKFGLMSFLVPRYQLMLGAEDDLYSKFKQFFANNDRPRDPMTGERFESWDDINDLSPNNSKGSNSTDASATLENIASEAVCARWLPNLERICSTTTPNLTFYGVNIADNYSSSASLLSPSEDPDSGFPNIHFYSPKGDSTSQQYILDSLTVEDGWGTEFFYYSRAPYQSYQLWSAGENGRTFPPWVSRSKLSSEANKCVYIWTHDDIKGMKN